MSEWTHVAGVIRIDGMPFLVGLTPEQEEAEIRKMIGNTCDFGDGNEKWDACTVPCGSEGSIQYGFSHVAHDDVKKHGKMTIQSAGVVRGVVAIWGDLRNYDSKEKIVEWFSSVLARFSNDNPENTGCFFIRDAVLNIEFRKGKTVCIWDGKRLVRRSVAKGVE